MMHDTLKRLHARRYWGVREQPHLFAAAVQNQRDCFRHAQRMTHSEARHCLPAASGPRNRVHAWDEAAAAGPGHAGGAVDPELGLVTPSWHNEGAQTHGPVAEQYQGGLPGRSSRASSRGRDPRAHASGPLAEQRQTTQPGRSSRASRSSQLWNDKQPVSDQQRDTCNMEQVLDPGSRHLHGGPRS